MRELVRVSELHKYAPATADNEGSLGDREKVYNYSKTISAVTKKKIIMVL